MAAQSIAVVIPVLNEEPGLSTLVRELLSVLEGSDFSWNVLFVDDGSTDGTLAKLKEIHANDRRFTAISFSRNFGKEDAIAAGLRYARGDAVVLMDADLQHPPCVIPRFIQRWREGYKVVFGQRQDRGSHSFLRNLSSWAFQVAFRRITPVQLPFGIVDFLLLDREAVDVLNRLGETTRFSKGLYAWIGFPSAIVPFVSSKHWMRTSRWSFSKLVEFAFDAFVSFSSLPLKVWSYVGALVSLGALVYAAYTLVSTLLFGTELPGLPLLFVTIVFFAGVQLVSVGVIGEYLARIYEEVKGRPLYVVAEEIGISGVAGAAAAGKEARREPIV